MDGDSLQTLTAAASAGVNLTPGAGYLMLESGAYRNFGKELRL